MISLAMCQLYYRDRDAASLTLHRFLVYLDFKEEKEGKSEVTDYFKITAGQLLSGYGSTSLDAYAGYESNFKARDKQDWEESDFHDPAASTEVDDFWEDGDLRYFGVFQ